MSTRDGNVQLNLTNPNVIYCFFNVNECILASMANFWSKRRQAEHQVLFLFEGIVTDRVSLPSIAAGDIIGYMQLAIQERTWKI